MMNNIPNLDNLIAAYECWNSPYKSECDHCLYGYSYLDDSGDGRPFYACDEQKLTDDMYAWLKIYQHLTEENK